MNYIGLFAGCGGADYGFHKSGFNIIGSFDNNPTALSVLKNNLMSPVYKVNLETEDILKYIPENSIEVVFSGAPCQGFSTAGNRDINDPRNNLLVRGGEIALTIQPKVFISENVMGSLSGAHKTYWDKLDRIFHSNNYKTQFIKVNCLDVGMAQMRKRVLFFAWRGKTESIAWPKPAKHLSLQDVLQNIESAPNNSSVRISDNTQIIEIAKRIKPSQKLSNVRGGNRAIATWEMPEIFGKVSDLERNILISVQRLRRQVRRRNYGDADPVHLSLLQKLYGNEISTTLTKLVEKGFIRKVDSSYYDLKNTFNGKYRRLHWDSPSPTVDTRFGNPNYFLHPEEHRGFTVREAARIQGFPDTFLFQGSTREQYKMIGNAVPPPLSEVIAQITKSQLL